MKRDLGDDFEEEEEKKEVVGHEMQDGQLAQYDQSLMESPDGMQNSAVYVEQTRLHTDGVEDSSMAEEDLGLDDDSFSNRRAASGFGSYGSRLNVGTIKASLPVLKINVPLHLSTHDIFEIFSGVSASQKFQIIEME